jgi:hypothetical protein
VSIFLALVLCPSHPSALPHLLSFAARLLLLLLQTADACMGTIGAPNFYWVVLGGYPTNPDNVTASNSLIVTWLMDNDPSKIDMATAWETEWLKEVTRVPIPGLKISYSAEVLFCSALVCCVVLLLL